MLSSDPMLTSNNHMLTSLTSRWLEVNICWPAMTTHWPGVTACWPAVTTSVTTHWTAAVTACWPVATGELAVKSLELSHHKCSVWTAFAGPGIRGGGPLDCLLKLFLQSREHWSAYAEHQCCHSVATGLVHSTRISAVFPTEPGTEVMTVKMETHAEGERLKLLHARPYGNLDEVGLCWEGHAVWVGIETG